MTFPSFWHIEQVGWCLQVHPEAVEEKTIT